MRGWLDATGNSLGAVVEPQRLYDLGKAWYAGRLDEDYVPLTLEEKVGIFERLGFTGKFWSFGG